MSQVKARVLLHPADPMLSILELAEEATLLLQSVETYIVNTHAADTAEDRYRASCALANHLRAVQSKTKVAHDKAGVVQRLSLQACKREHAIKHGSEAGSYFDQRDLGDETPEVITGER